MRNDEVPQLVLEDVSRLVGQIACQPEPLPPRLFQSRQGGSNLVRRPGNHDVARMVEDEARLQSIVAEQGVRGSRGVWDRA